MPRQAALTGCSWCDSGYIPFSQDGKVWHVTGPASRIQCNRFGRHELLITTLAYPPEVVELVRAARGLYGAVEDIECETFEAGDTHVCGRLFAGLKSVRQALESFKEVK